MYVSGMAVWNAWQEAGGAEVSLLAGHSLGEYVALTAAGVFDYAEALSVVAERGRLMANAVPAGVGGMAAVLGLEDEVIVEVCQSISGERVVEAVNFNAPGQVVISGHLDAVEKATQALKEKGARRAMILPVSVPNHSSLMNAVAAPLAERIAAMTLGEAKIPVVQNLQAKSYDSTAEMMSALKKHVCSPVYWTDSVRNIKAQGADIVVEMGPGKVLTGLKKRIDKAFEGVFVENLDSLEKSMKATQVTV
jgi:[acyl-carrier-protein] S-malonyltransferase